MNRGLVFGVGLIVLAFAVLTDKGHSMIGLWVVGGVLTVVAGLALLAPEKRPDARKGPEGEG